VASWSPTAATSTDRRDRGSIMDVAVGPTIAVFGVIAVVIVAVIWLATRSR
jgi:hypothetical protein